jgi:hypothetical protein
VDGKGQGEYFDSFGLPPAKEEFIMFLDNSSIRWTFNTKTVQYMLSDACGYHCIFFAIHRCVGFNMNTVVNMYTNNLLYNDSIVKQFVCEKVLS